MESYLHKNFFENILPQIVQDRSESSRSVILQMFDTNHLLTDFTHLIQYINQRYPHITALKNLENLQSVTTTTTQYAFQCENSKINVHNIFNLFDPDLRPKAIQTKVLTSNVKAPIIFKRLAPKLTALSTLSRAQTNNKIIDSLKTTGIK